MAEKKELYNIQLPFIMVLGQKNMLIFYKKLLFYLPLRL